MEAILFVIFVICIILVSIFFLLIKKKTKKDEVLKELEGVDHQYIKHVTLRPFIANSRKGDPYNATGAEIYLLENSMIIFPYTSFPFRMDLPLYQLYFKDRTFNRLSYVYDVCPFVRFRIKPQGALIEFWSSDINLVAINFLIEDPSELKMFKEWIQENGKQENL